MYQYDIDRDLFMEETNFNIICSIYNNSGRQEILHNLVKISIELIYLIPKELFFKFKFLCTSYK